MTIKGIFFDAAGVFYRRPESTGEHVSQALKHKGLSTELPAEVLNWMRDLRSQANSGRVSPDEYWDQVLLMSGITSQEERKALLAWISDNADKVVPIPGGREALAELKCRGFVLSIITDTMHPVERKMIWLQKVGVAEYVDSVTCSSVLGVHKPDPAIYLDAMQQAHLTPSESAFVGHDTEELEGARKAGMATVAVNYDPDAKADYYAQSLMDLPNVPIFKTAHTGKVETMNHDIEVIFIDVGATLRVLVKDAPYQAQAKQQIAALVGTTEPTETFCAELDRRYKVYRKWAFDTLLEASERDLWTRWMLPDYPSEKIGALAGELTFLYRKTMGRRFAQSDAKDVVVELTRRGYRLGIISNTITEREIPQWLEEDGLSRYFPTVVLSSIFGRRKPGPEIYLEAARRAKVHPAQAVYVGDNPIRDVVGARLAGFGMVIIMPEPDDEEKLASIDDNKPDRVIQKLSDLLDIFPERKNPHAIG
jgi:putative hydrolase of the HAD superfamily